MASRGFARLGVQKMTALVLLVAACSQPAPTGESQPGSLSVAATLGAGADDDLSAYSQALEPRALVFPADHGPHPDFKTEWWYWIGHLETAGGRRFGYQLTIFRSALAPPAPLALVEERDAPSNWSTRQLYMAHLALSDIDGDPAIGPRFHSAERFSRGALGLAGARADPFLVWLEDWEVAAVASDPDVSAERWRLTARAESFALDLELEAGKPRVEHGERGFSRKGEEPGAASYYYSQTRMPTRGGVEVSGERFEVTGRSWLDREWSTSLLAEDEVGWDWVGATLDDGRELMLFRLRRADGSNARIDGTLVAADGSHRSVRTRGVEWRELGSWSSPESGVTYPAGFLLRIPAEELELEVRPMLADQELRTSFVYWEGAVTISGDARGVGYLEMTGYGDRASPR